MNPEKKTSFTKKESLPDFIDASILRDLGQLQYVMRPLTNAFPTEYPNLGEGIRYEGDYSNYHTIKIHKDDILIYAERYIDWKNLNSTPFSKLNKEKIIENLKIKIN